MTGTTGKAVFGARTSAEEVVSGLDLSSQTIIVTGANTGIGEAAAQALAGAGARVIYACRERKTCEEAVQRTRSVYPDARAEFAELDLASFASIRRFVDTLVTDRVDTLICNAGLSLMNFAGTAEGYERTVGVCHIGHFLLTRLLMPRLLAAPAPRVVMVSSNSHKLPARLDFAKFPMSKENFNGLTAYGQAKLCNVLMAKSLQRRYGSRGLVACALHPGTLIATEIGRHSAVVGALIKLIRPFTKTRSQGASTTVWAAVHEPAKDLAGQYLLDCHVSPSSAESNNSDIAERVWKLTEGWVQSVGPITDWP